MKYGEYQGARGWFNEETSEFFPETDVQRGEYGGKSGLFHPATSSFFPVDFNNVPKPALKSNAQYEFALSGELSQPDAAIVRAVHGAPVGLGEEFGRAVQRGGARILGDVGVALEQAGIAKQERQATDFYKRAQETRPTVTDGIVRFDQRPINMQDQRVSIKDGIARFASPEDEIKKQVRSTVDPNEGIAGVGRETWRFWDKVASAPELAQSKDIQGSIVDRPDLLNPLTDQGRRWWASQIGEMGTSMAPTIAVAASTGNPIAAGLFGGFQEAAGTYKDLINKGWNPIDAREASLNMGAGSAALNAIPFMAAFGKVPGLKSRVAKWLVSAVTESGTEYLEEPWEEISKGLVTGQIDKKELARSLKDGVNVLPVSFLFGLANFPAGQAILNDAGIKTPGVAQESTFQGAAERAAQERFGTPEAVKLATEQPPIAAVQTATPAPVAPAGDTGIIAPEGATGGLESAPAQALQTVPQVTKNVTLEGGATEAFPGASLTHEQAMQMPLSEVRALKAENPQLAADIALYKAGRSPVTSLPNRAALDDVLRASEAEGRDYHFVALDLDGFKTINDTLGHNVGDAVLQGVQKAAKAAGLDLSQETYHQGGDEFGFAFDVENGSKKQEALTNALARTIIEVTDDQGNVVGTMTGIAATINGEVGRGKQGWVKADSGLKQLKAERERSGDRPARGTLDLPRGVQLSPEVEGRYRAGREIEERLQRERQAIAGGPGSAASGGPEQSRPVGFVKAHKGSVILKLRPSEEEIVDTLADIFSGAASESTNVGKAIKNEAGEVVDRGRSSLPPAYQNLESVQKFGTAGFAEILNNVRNGKTITENQAWYVRRLVDDHAGESGIDLDGDVLNVNQMTVGDLFSYAKEPYQVVRVNDDGTAEIENVDSGDRQTISSKFMVDKGTLRRGGVVPQNVQRKTVELQGKPSELTGKVPQLEPWEVLADDYSGAVAEGVAEKQGGYGKPESKPEGGERIKRGTEKYYLSKAESFDNESSAASRAGKYSEAWELSDKADNARRKAAAIRLEKQGITSESTASKNLPKIAPGVRNYQEYALQTISDSDTWGVDGDAIRRTSYYQALLDYESYHSEDRRLVKLTHSSSFGRRETAVEIIKRPSFIEKLIRYFPGMDRETARSIERTRNKDNEDPYLIAQAWARHNLTDYESRLEKERDFEGEVSDSARNRIRGEIRDSVEDQMRKWSEPNSSDPSRSPEAEGVAEKKAGYGKKATLSSLLDKWEKLGVSIDVFDYRDAKNTRTPSQLMKIHRIEVAKDQRKRGLGTMAMNDLTGYADKNGLRIELSPDDGLGATSKGRLREFYKRFGFVENRGRNKDYRTSATMFRNPVKSDLAKEPETRYTGKHEALPDTGREAPGRPETGTEAGRVSEAGGSPAAGEFQLTPPESPVKKPKPTQQGLALGMTGKDLRAPERQNAPLTETPLEKSAREAKERAAQPGLFAELENADKPLRVIGKPKVEVVHETIGHYESSVTKISGPEDVAHIVSEIGRSPQEKFQMVIADSEGRVLSVLNYALGSHVAALVHPQAMGRVLNVPGAAQVWFAHNHPSGDARPSSEDIRLTKRLSGVLKKTPVKYSGHVILGEDGWFDLSSYNESGDLQTKEGTYSSDRVAEGAVHKIPVIERRLKTRTTSDKGITASNEVREYGKQNLPDGGIVLVNAKNVPVATLSLPSDMSGMSGPIHTALVQEIEKANATGMFVYSPKRNMKAEEVRSLSSFAELMGVSFLDTVDTTNNEANLLSWRDRGMISGARETETPYSAASDKTLDALVRKSNKEDRTAFAKVFEMARRVYDSGKNKWETFEFAMQKRMGGAWFKLKSLVRKAWDRLKAINEGMGERGSVGERSSLNEFQRKQVATPEFKEWFGDSKVVDSKGRPSVVYHGTTGVFSKFNKEKGNAESDFGAGFYFTNSTQDASKNYAGLGPDLTNKVERDAERISAEENISIEEAREKVKGQYMASQGAIMPVYLSIQNPLIVGGKKDSFLAFEMGMDEETGDFTGDESGKLVDFIMGLRNEAAMYSDGEVGDLVNSIIEASMDGGISASTLVEIVSKDEQFNYFTDDNGNLASKEIFRSALERAGFDGVIDNSVNVKFGSERRIGKKMEGMGKRTTHYIAFRPEQIKSATGNSGAFSQDDPSIVAETETPYGKKKSREELTAEWMKSVSDAIAAGKPVPQKVIDDFVRRGGKVVKSEAKGLRESGDRLSKASEQATATLKDFIDRTPKAGLSVADMSKRKAVNDDVKMPGAEKLESDSKDVEFRWRKSKGISQKSLVEKIKEGAANIWELRKPFPGLDYKEDAKVVNALREFSAVPEYSKYMAAETTAGVLAGLGPKKYDIFTRNVILPDIVKDIESGLLSEDRLPFGYSGRAAVERDLQKFQRIADANTDIKATLDRRAAFQRALTEELVRQDLLPKEVLEDPRYFHHQVLQYMEARTAYPGTGSKDVREHKKGFQRGRKGSSLDYNTEYVESEFEYVAQALAQIKTKEIVDRIGAVADISEKVKADAKAGSVKDWRKAIPEGYTTWQPKPGTTWYKTLSVPERVIEEVLAGTKELSESDLREVVARGARRKEWVIPERVATMLDNFRDFSKDEGFDRLTRSVMATWKQWILLNPVRVLKYNINNMSGDLDIALAYDPKILKYFKQAAGEAWDSRKGAAMSRDMREAMEYGVIGSGFSIQEIPDVREIGFFKVLMGDDSNIISRYWEQTKELTQWRENILRVAAYKYFKKQIADGKAVYGVSRRESVDAETDGNKKAALLARDLVGDYGNISAAGQWLRQRMIPFWSWTEINAPRYLRLIKNASYEDRASGAATAGRVAGVGAKKAAMQTGKVVLQANILYAAIALWNAAIERMLDLDDDEKRALYDDRRQQHLILGRTDDGQVRTLRIQGALSDALDWMALGDWPDVMRDLLSGKTTVAGQAKEMAKAPINRLVNASHPMLKMAGEVMTGKQIYPDVFNTRPIRDKTEHALRLFSMDMPYRYLTGKPTKGLRSDILGTLTYSSDPGERSYWIARKLAFDHLEKSGKEIPSAEPTKRSSALYYYKQAKRYGDKKAMEKYMNEYIDLGGTWKGLSLSLERGSPLGSIAKRDQEDFFLSLSVEDKRQVELAEKWYDKNMRISGEDSFYFSKMSRESD